MNKVKASVDNSLLRYQPDIMNFQQAVKIEIRKFKELLKHKKNDLIHHLNNDIEGLTPPLKKN